MDERPVIVDTLVEWQSLVRDLGITDEHGTVFDHRHTVVFNGTEDCACGCGTTIADAIRRAGVVIMTCEDYISVRQHHAVDSGTKASLKAKVRFHQVLGEEKATFKGRST